MSPSPEATAPQVRDLVLLASDRDIEFALRGLLRRAPELGFRQIDCDFYVHPQHDPGCFLRSQEFLRAFLRSHARALVVFDREGCGGEPRSRVTIEQEVERSLAANGWGDRAAAVVIDPEMEQWVWTDCPEVDAVLGWRDHAPSLRSWLRSSGRLLPGHPKPLRPKEAVQEALRLVRKPRSSALYQDLATVTRIETCVDSAFGKLRATLATWFGVEESQGAT
jgi:hypothetical protein